MGSQAIPQPPSPEARTALDALRRVVRMLRESSATAQRRTGISGAQLFVLQQLREGRALSLRQLAERTATHESSVSVVVQRLVDARLVKRTRSAEDGRRVELALLTRGSEALRRAPPLPQEKLIAALEALPPRERRALSRSLETVVSSLGLDAHAPEMFFESKGAARAR